MDDADQQTMDRRSTDSAMIQLQQQFLEHTRDEAAWRRDQDRRWEHLDSNWAQLVEVTRSTAESQKRTAESVESLAVSTKDIIEFSRDVKGVARIGQGFQRICKFILQWGAIGVGVVAALNWIIDHFSNTPGP